MRILIDMDDTLVKFSDRWYNKHNQEYGHIHELASGAGWEDGSRCKDANCDADIFQYFNDADLWSDGEPLPDSINITQQWIQQGHELGIVTKIPAKHIEAAQYKYLGLQRHFSHIKPIFFVTDHTKHWIDADIMLDDGLMNHDGFKSISLLYDQPWNRSNTTLPRIRDWQHADKVIQRADYLIKRQRSLHSEYISYGDVQWLLANEINAGNL